jgi:hypothetical protein
MGPSREATKDRTFDLNDIGTFFADHRAPKVGHGIRRSRKGAETQDTVSGILYARKPLIERHMSR